jgi:hypothetical protein
VLRRSGGARTAARTRGLGQGARRGAGGSGRACLGRRAASGGAGADARALPAAAGEASDVAVRRRSSYNCFAGAVFEMNLLQNFV